MPKLTIEVSDDDMSFLRAMATISKLKIVDDIEDSGFRVVNHSTESLASHMLHRDIQQASIKLKEIGIVRSPW